VAIFSEHSVNGLLFDMAPDHNCCQQSATVGICC